MKTNFPPTDPRALDVKTPTEPVAPPKPPGAKPPAGGYRRGVAKSSSRDGWEEIQPSNEHEDEEMPPRGGEEA